MSKNYAQKTLRIAEEHYRANRLAEAEKKCKAILLLNPNDREALRLAIGIARWQARNTEAMQMAAHAAVVHPDVADFHVQLGELSRAAGLHEQAVTALQRAVEVSSANAAILDSLACALFETRQYEKVLEASDKALALEPSDVNAWSNRAGALRELGRIDEAVVAVETALRLYPDLAAAHLNLALLRQEQERFDEALASTNRALAIQPNYAEAHYNLGVLHLLLGDMKEGWAEYQWRPGRKVPSPRPVWDGQDPRGRTIGLFAEQGFGDAIQFARYIPLLEQRGARVWLSCRNELVRLLEPLTEIVRPGQPLPAHDFACPLLDLPMRFGTTVETIPAMIGYLQGQSIERNSPTLRVGLAWAGSPTHRNDRRRSLSLEQLKPILAVPNVEWVNLQVGPAARQAEGSIIRPPDRPLGDFADTRDVIATLDLVIAADTAIAHLAGAMGKNVWVLLAKVPDWRWMLHRSDTPWYPTMRLFRQEQYGQWEHPTQEIAGNLGQLRDSRANDAGGRA